jgi:hypothetical protein
MFIICAVRGLLGPQFYDGQVFDKSSGSKPKPMQLVETVKRSSLEKGLKVPELNHNSNHFEYLESKERKRFQKSIKTDSAIH